MNVLLRCAAAIGLVAMLAACEDGRIDVSLSADRPATSLQSVVVSIDGLVLRRADNSEDTINFDTPLVIDLLDYDTASFPLLDGEALDAGDYNGIRLRLRDTGSNDNFVVDASGLRRSLSLVGADAFEPLLFTVKDGGGKRYALDLRLDLRLSLAASGETRSLKPVLRATRSTRAASVSGSVSDSLVRGTRCQGSGVAGVGVAVYAFNGSGVTPDDMDGSQPDPIASAPVLSDGGGSWSYRLRLLPPGDYTLALTCDGDIEDALRNDAIEFLGAARNVSLDDAEDGDLDFRN